MDGLTNPDPWYGWLVISRRVHRQTSITSNSGPDERIGRETVVTKLGQLDIETTDFQAEQLDMKGAGIEHANSCTVVCLTAPPLLKNQSHPSNFTNSPYFSENLYVVEERESSDIWYFFVLHTSIVLYRQSYWSKSTKSSHTHFIRKFDHKM